MIEHDRDLRDELNSRLGHGVPVYGPQPRDPRSEYTQDAIADFACLAKAVLRHEHEAFVELWLGGRFHTYCANTGTAVVLAASALGMNAQTLNDMQEGLR